MTNNNEEIINRKYSISIPLRSSFNRKVLARKFDFTPFQKQQNDHHYRNQDHHHHDRKKQVQEDKDHGREIDPRYGVEKRKVPSGPNPLHH